MSKTSIIMLPNTQGQLTVVGDKIRADGWYGYTDGLHTVAIYLVNFTGRIWFEASIANDPIDGDWFPVIVGGSDHLSFPKYLEAPTGTTGDTGTIGLNISGNYTWLRVRIDRDQVDVDPALLGHIDRILLNN